MKNNTPTRYTAPAIGLHWLLALLIIGMLAAGLIMTDLTPTPFKFTIYQYHKSFGLLILALAVARLVWRFGHPVPKLPAGPAWQHWVAHITHVALYVSLFSMPITGWLMSDAAGYHPNFFGLSVPVITAANPEWAGFWKDLHEINSNILIALLAAHIGAALYHHLIKRDAILTRMVPTWLKLPRPTVPYAKQLAKVLGAVLLLVVPMVAQAVPLWVTQRTSSTLTWQSAFNGQPVSGKFYDWETKIVFSPTDLPHSHISVNITTNSVSSADKQRDETLRSRAFFNVLDFPLATFNSSQIISATLTNAEPGYVAMGNFTLAGVTRPLNIPFSLMISGTQAIASGSVTLSRSEFKVGQGEWASTSVIPEDVTVSFNIVANQADEAALAAASQQAAAAEEVAAASSSDETPVANSVTNNAETVTMAGAVPSPTEPDVTFSTTSVTVPASPTTPTVVINISSPTSAVTASAHVVRAGAKATGKPRPPVNLNDLKFAPAPEDEPAAETPALPNAPAE